MAMDGGNLRLAGGTADWSPPEPDFLILPLNLRAQLARFGIGSDDLIVIDGMPADAELTAGTKKPDGSWSLREIDLDACNFMPLYGNGETYTLRACVLTPDFSDHGLPKTKGKADIKVEVPLTPLPILEAFDDVAIPAPAPSAAADTVIQLPADPKLKAIAPVPPPPAAPAPSSAPPAAPPPAVSAESAPATSPQAQPTADAAPVPAKPAAPRTGTFDEKLAKLRAEWQANVARQVAAAEQRLKASHLVQMGKIQGTRTPTDAPQAAAMDSKPSPAAEGTGDRAPAVEERLAAARRQWQAEHEAALAQARETWRSEEAARLAAAEAEWRADAMQQRIALEVRLEESYKERLAALEAAMAAKPNPPATAAPKAEDWSAKLECAIADAQVGWEVDEAERRAKLEADLAAAHERRIAEIESQQAALFEMRLTAAEAAWRKAEADRLVAAEAVWSIGEAERLAASEARWRAEHDKKLETVLANFGAMVKGQLGTIGAAIPPPAIEAAAAPVAAQQAEDGAAETEDSAAGLGWRKTAAA